MSATKHLAAAFERARPELADDEPVAQQLAREARRAPDRWGRGEHELVLERVWAFGDPARLCCPF